MLHSRKYKTDGLDEFILKKKSCAELETKRLSIGAVNTSVVVGENPLKTAEWVAPSG